MQYQGYSGRQPYEPATRLLLNGGISKIIGIVRIIRRKVFRWLIISVNFKIPLILMVSPAPAVCFKK